MTGPAQTDARTEVLTRIRAALGPTPQVPEVTRGYRTAGDRSPGAPELLDLLSDRLVDYKAGVHRCTSDELPGVIAEVLARTAGQGRIVVPAALPQQWTAGADVLRDDGTTSTAELDTVAGVLTACAVAVAETGTIVLDAGPDQGRRALSLVPDLHLCVVRADQVVQTVPEALRRLDPRRPLTWISGPSATSDIELNRVEGVHGPRTLEVLLVGP
jgi:L-lactate dehydrogenase complex protein LldG